jgi:hypothetical protein
VFYRIMEMAVGQAPVRHDELILVRRPGPTNPPTPPPVTGRSRTASVKRPQHVRPWRAA